MKTIAAVGLMLALGATDAGAVDIQDKWGIGAGVFRGRGEVSLIRGKSDRSAWLFDASLRLDDYSRSMEGPSPSESNFSFMTATAGPGYRRFLRPADTFSPYWDGFLHGVYTRDHFGGARSQNRQSIGMQTGVAFGLEYFTRWSFSVAAHTEFARLQWAHTRFDSRSPFGTEMHSSGHYEGAWFGLAPILFLRAYF